jgi:hypothetical protein
MTPDTPSTRVTQPGSRAGRRSSGYRSVPVSPLNVRAVVDATVLTGDSSSISAGNPAKATRARLEPPGVCTNEVIARWLYRPYQRARECPSLQRCLIPLR